MKKALVFLLLATIVNAGRTSQWSSTFMLREPVNTISNGRNAGAGQNRFDMTVRQNPHGRSALLYVSGVFGETRSSLRIYRVDGKLVADLSDLVSRGGSPQVVWNTPRLPAGIFFARLQSGTRIKIVKFVLAK
jgi:hypothetical protein